MNPIEMLQQYYWIIIVAYLVGFFGVLAYFLTKNRGKILVRIKQPGLPEKEVWRKPEVHGQQTRIIMEKDEGKQAGWKFTFDNDCLILRKSLLKTYFALDVKPDAPRACKWTGTLPDSEQPTLTKSEVKQYAKTQVFERRYNTKEAGTKSSAILIIGILTAGTLVLGIINFLQSRGLRI